MAPSKKSDVYNIAHRKKIKSFRKLKGKRTPTMHGP